MSHHYAPIDLDDSGSVKLKHHSRKVDTVAVAGQGHHDR